MLRNQTIMIVGGCNLSCTYCWYEVGSSTYGAESVQVAEYDRWFAASARLEPLESVAITGGEPLLRADFAEILSTAHAHCGQVAVFTNGTLLKPTLVADMARLGTEVHVSIDHVDPGMADRVRGGTKASLASLEMLSAGDVRAVQVCMVVTSRNWTDVRAMAEYVRACGFGLELIPVAVPDIHPLSLRTLTDAQRAALAGELATQGDLLGRRLYYSRFASYLTSGRLPKPASCHAGDNGIFINSEGEVTVCGQRTDVVLGNVKSTSPADVALAKKHEIDRRPPGRCVTLDCVVLV
jgi:uncharacterized protein